MEEVVRLEHLSLVSKICTELENHLGLNDKDLAEFIIHLAEKNDTFETFKNALVENGAEFSDSFIVNLLRIIQHMKPKHQKESSPQLRNEKDRLAEKFPGLAIPNGPKCQSHNAEKGRKEKKKSSAQDDIVSDLMAELEALAPSQIGTSRIKLELSSHSGNKCEASKPVGTVDPSRKKKHRRSHTQERDDDFEIKRKRRSHSQDKHRKSRSRSREKPRRRTRNNDKSSEKRSRERNRYLDRRERRNRSNSKEKRGRPRDRNASPSAKRKCDSRSRVRDKKVADGVGEQLVATEPEIGKIYSGKVANIVPFGCFVQLEGLRRRWEGLVHISQLRREGRVTNVSDVVARGHKVKVKVLSFTGQKVSLSMKDVNQDTGEDLNPTSLLLGKDRDEDQAHRNTDRPTSLLELQGSWLRKMREEYYQVHSL
jgi:ATP-dependent RNA helicase DHX8/PRP22